MKETKHLGVYGIIKNENKILLVRKSRGAYTGKLDIPGGSFEHGEKPEETNAKVKSFELKYVTATTVEWVHHEEKESMHHIGIVYDVEINDISAIKNSADGFTLWELIGTI